MCITWINSQSETKIKKKKQEENIKFNYMEIVWFPNWLRIEEKKKLERKYY